MGVSLPATPAIRRGRLIPAMLALVLLAGCATPPPPDGRQGSTPSVPQEGLVIQRAILTARGRQFALNGYLALSRTEGKRLVLTHSLGQVLADLLVLPDGAVRVVRSSPMLSPDWIERYVAADLECLFGGGRSSRRECPVWQVGPNRFVIQRRRYTLEVQILETRGGSQPSSLFDPDSRISL